MGNADRLRPMQGRQSQSESIRSDAQRSVDAILQAARDALAEDSTAGLSTIAARAGVHRVTLYRHFPTRAALDEALHNAYLDDTERAAAEIDLGADDLLAEIKALVRRVYGVNIAWRTHAWAPAYSAGTPERKRRRHQAEMTFQLFEAAQQQGLLRQDLDQSELLAVWGGPIHYLTGRVVDGDWTLDKVVGFLMHLLTHEPRVEQGQHA